MNQLPASVTNPVDVREQWRALSLSEVWLRPDDWYHAAVDALVEAVGVGRGPVAAAQRLGAARGTAGVGMGESLDDLTCLYRSLGQPTDLTAVRALAIGWAEGFTTGPAAFATHDAASDLPTTAYLAERIRETYGRAERKLAKAADLACLIVLDVALDDMDAWSRMARVTTVGRTLNQVFGEGHPMAAITDGVYAILSEEDDRAADLAQSLRRVLNSNAEILGFATQLRRPTRVWIEQLPARYADAVDLLNHLGR